jgi:hypothetical protein
MRANTRTDRHCSFSRHGVAIAFAATSSQPAMLMRVPVNVDTSLQISASLCDARSNVVAHLQSEDVVPAEAQGKAMSRPGARETHGLAAV